MKAIENILETMKYFMITY